MKQVWLLEEFFNDYDQHGGVTLAVFGREPTEEDLKPFGYTYFGFKTQKEYSWVEKSIMKVSK